MIKVMIVDDEPYIRQGLQILIQWEQYGYEIAAEAANGKEALEILDRKEIDLIITDIKMPQMDGIELIQKVRDMDRDIHFVILSGFYEFEYAKKAIQYEVGDYILKPVHKEELVRVLEDYKEKYFRKQEEQKKIERSEKIFLDSCFFQLLSGIYEPSSLEYMKEYLTDDKEIRYIDLGYDSSDDNYRQLSHEEKLSRQNTLYDVLKEYMGIHRHHVLIDPLRSEEDYSVGFLYAKALAEEKQMDEREYINHLYEAVKSHLPYNLIIYIGQKAEDISQLSESYKSTKIARNFPQISEGSDIAYYDEIKKIENPEKYLVDKEMMDVLIRAMEQNDQELIMQRTEAVYQHLKDWSEEPEVIKINLDYLFFNLISLVKELDGEVDLSEIYQMISLRDYEQVGIRGSFQHFLKFTLEFSDYLNQLRQQVGGGVLKEIEREITEHYMENLSLKSLSEKYYMNSAYLGQSFKRQYGIPFKDYLNNYRIEKACELLLRSDQKIYAIADEVGFNNTDYFISRFVQLKGVTPLQYRKQYLKQQK